MEFAFFLKTIGWYEDVSFNLLIYIHFCISHLQHIPKKVGALKLLPLCDAAITFSQHLKRAFWYWGYQAMKGFHMLLYLSQGSQQYWVVVVAFSVSRFFHFRKRFSSTCWKTLGCPRRRCEGGRFLCKISVYLSNHYCCYSRRVNNFYQSRPHTITEPGFWTFCW